MHVYHAKYHNGKKFLCHIDLFFYIFRFENLKIEKTEIEKYVFVVKNRMHTPEHYKPVIPSIPRTSQRRKKFVKRVEPKFEKNRIITDNEKKVSAFMKNQERDKVLDKTSTNRLDPGHYNVNNNFVLPRTPYVTLATQGHESQKWLEDSKPRNFQQCADPKNLKPKPRVPIQKHRLEEKEIEKMKKQFIQSRPFRNTVPTSATQECAHNDFDATNAFDFDKRSPRKKLINQSYFKAKPIPNYNLVRKHIPQTSFTKAEVARQTSNVQEGCGSKISYDVKLPSSKR